MILKVFRLKVFGFDVQFQVKISKTSEVVRFYDLSYLGVVQQYMNDPANAMKDFQQAIEADPTYSLAYFNAANLYFNMRLFEKALKYYDAAVKNCVDDEGAVLNRLVCLFVCLSVCLFVCLFDLHYDA